VHVHRLVVPLRRGGLSLADGVDTVGHPSKGGVVRETLKDLGSLMLGLIVLLVLLPVAVLFIKGGLWAAEHFLPALATVGGIALGVDLFVLVPLSIVRRLRPITGGGILISSYIFGATLWLAALVLTYSVWGLVAVFIGVFLFGIGVVPVALLATAMNGMWSPFWGLIVTAVCMLGARIVGLLIIGASAREAATMTAT